jgi:hypothetical protein
MYYWGQNTLSFVIRINEDLIKNDLRLEKKEIALPEFFFNTRYER